MGNLTFQRLYNEISEIYEVKFNFKMVLKITAFLYIHHKTTFLLIFSTHVKLCVLLPDANAPRGTQKFQSVFPLFS